MMRTWYAYILGLLGFSVMALSDSAPYGVVRARVGNLRDNAYGVVVQPDGKILTAGASFNGQDSDMVLVRYLPDGAVDRYFGDGGAVVMDSEVGDDKGYAVAVNWDGKIYVAGETHNGKNTDFAVWRFTPAGKLDTGFGMKGLARIDFGQGDDVAYSIAIQNDGKLVLGGVAMGKKDRDFAVAKFLESGLPDVGFGYNGKLTTALSDRFNRSGDETGYCVLLQNDGKIVLTGFSEVEGTSVMAAIRYFNDGRLDKEFGDKGSTFTSFEGHSDRAYTAAIDPSGRIVMAGSSTNAKTSEFAIVRLNARGKLDRYFGLGGLATAAIGGVQDTVYGLGFDGDGRIITAGSSVIGGELNLALSRFTEAGTVDPNFGASGRILLPGEGKYGAAYGLAVQEDGRIVAAGVSSHGTGYQIALARYQSNGTLDATFGLGNRGMQMARSQGPTTPVTAEAGIGGLFNWGN